jgi:S1-C subfamily serine protease/Uma2 family endonuclease
MTRSLQADDFFPLATPREGSGSGSVLDKQGHVLTNYHVVEDARQIAVTLFDSTTHAARLVGSDPQNDLAVLKIDAPPQHLHPIAWGDSTKLLVGMRVFAIGNPFGLERTLTTGIVSSLNRSLRTENQRKIRGIIQTDAAINPGGPLLNRRGEVIGITTAIVGRTGQSSGISLAIPASTARRVVDELIRHGRVIRPDCGIFSVYETERGRLIARLDPDGPAARAGLRGPQEQVVRRGGFIYRSVDRSKADLVVAAAGRPVKTLDDLLGYVESKKPGDTVVLRMVREGQRMDVPVELEQTQARERYGDCPCSCVSSPTIMTGIFRPEGVGMTALMTPESVLPAGPPENRADVLYEVVDGRCVELAPMSTFAGVVASRVHWRLAVHANEKQLGEAVHEVLFGLSPRRRRPDVALVSCQRWTRGHPISSTDPWPVVPNLAVEVVSPTDNAEPLLGKVAEYLQAGVDQVWVSYPLLKLVYVYESLTKVRGYAEADELDGGDVMPGFKLSLSALFADSPPSEEPTNGSQP